VIAAARRKSPYDHHEKPGCGDALVPARFGHRRRKGEVYGACRDSLHRLAVVTESADCHEAARCFTARAILAGAIGSIIISVGDPYAIHLLQGSYMAFDFSTAGAVFLFFVLVFLVNATLGRICRRSALNPGELIIAYIMMIVASAICSTGLTSQLLPIISAPYYYGREMPDCQRYLLPVLQKRKWLSPSTPESILYFYEGLPKGEHIPWAAWCKPLAVWLPFVFALYLVMIAMMVVIRRQWVERERLAFPLTHLPLEMVRGADLRPLTPFFRNPVMWIGFAIPFTVSSLLGLSHYFPYIPSVATRVSLPGIVPETNLVFLLSFPLLGFFYLVNMETLFSLWFLNLAFQFAAGYMRAHEALWQENLGVYGSPSPLFNHLGMGAMIALVVLGLWAARSHLRDVVLNAVRATPAVDDSGEIVSYRTAFWGMLGGLAFMWLWLTWSGLPSGVGLVFLAGAFVLFYGLTRVVAESGLAVAVGPSISASFVVSAFGSKAFGAQGLTSLAMNYVWSADMRTYVMASTANGLRMSDVMQCRKRPLFWVIWLAIMVSLAASIWMTMTLAYAKGGVNLNVWFMRDGPMQPYKWVIDKLSNPTEPNWPGWVTRAAGFGVMWFLMRMQQTFVWWPFHPIGFAMGSTWVMNEVWFTCFMVWVTKGLIVHFSGLRGYNFFRPAFLGFILGQFTCNGVWLVVDAAAGAKGNIIYWI
jgi:hypothetical protein